MNYPAASCGVSSSVLARHSVLDTESSRALWIPASAGMTNSRQAAGMNPQWIQETTVIAGHKEVVGVLAIDCRQVGQEIDGVRFHPADLAGEERQGVYADTHGVIP
jgi:hypothetical protein